MSRSSTTSSAGIFRVIWYRIHETSDVTTIVEHVTKSWIDNGLISFRLPAADVHAAFENYQAEVGKLELSNDPVGNNCALIYCGW